jgi:hypothetical protein
MTMKRTDLVAALKKVEPAVSSKGVIPIFGCFCFDGKTITTYDDQVALQMPFEIGIKGGIQGRLLLPWLDSSKARDISFEQTGDCVQFKARNATLDAPTLGSESFIFTFPKRDDGVKVIGPFDKDAATGFVLAVKRALISMGTDPAHPQMMGITCGIEGKFVSMYSTNDSSASMATIDLSKSLKKEFDEVSWMFPPRFASLLISFHGSDILSELILGKGWIEAKFVTGLRLFSKEVHETSLETFKKMFESIVSESVISSVVGLPKGFSAGVERALVVLDSERDKEAQLCVKEGRMTLAATSTLGKSFDAFVVDESCPACEETIKVDLIDKALPEVQGFSVVPRKALVLVGDDYVFLAVVGAKV